MTPAIGPGYLYHLPFYPIANPPDPVLGVHFDSARGPFIQLYSDSPLSEYEQYVRISKALSVVALFSEKGTSDRQAGGVGSFYEERCSQKLYGEVSDLTPLARMVYVGLDCEASAFQIQSRFTLSKAHSSSLNFESSAIEFFKVVELYIKHLAYTSQIGPKSVAAVKGGFLFKDVVKQEIIDRGFLSSELFDLLDNLRAVRNFYIAHGGIRPFVSRIVDDPERDNRVRVFNNLVAGHGYDLHLDSYFDDPLLTRIGVDFSLLSRFVFCKMHDVDPVLVYRGMCWWTASDNVMEVLKQDGAIFVRN